MALLSVADRALHIGVAGVLGGLGHGFIFPILSGLVVARARDSERGTAVAIFTSLFDVGMLLGGAGFGAVIERWSYEAMFATTAMIVIGVTATFYAWEWLRGDARPSSSGSGTT